METFSDSKRFGAVLKFRPVLPPRTRRVAKLGAFGVSGVT